MNKKSLSAFLVVLMFALQSWAISLQVPDEVTTERSFPSEVIPAPSSLNTAGFHEGTIFSEATLAAGGHHTCAILDNTSVSCWGNDDYGQQGNGLDDRII